MTRPNIIRADTIDLQNQSAPSAKDHTRQPARPGALGEGPPAPHQADALKHVEQELSEQHGRSPRASQDLSGKELQLLHEDGDGYNGTDGIGQDSNNLLRNAGGNGAVEEDVGDGDGDEGLDDDLMDKISSSPSIGDDGGCHLPLPWPSRVTSLHSNSSPPENTPSPNSPLDDFSSPFSETPTHFPLSFPRNEQDQTPSKDHHQKGGYTKDREMLPAVEELDFESRNDQSPLISGQRDSRFQEDFEDLEDSREADFDPDDFRHLLLPADDPLLDNSFDDAPLSPSSTASNASTASSSPASITSWDDKKLDENDDDTEDISFLDDPRFIDSGWGGECLREIEDIDFEFVYALHTFVATVEGQANATKGDTMVLLDDTNSYWWLVRVVKDTSIGYLPAEHIETPLERLARLNKHRNLDLASTMLGDEEEKRTGNSLNPLKKAMKRRNTKTVQFTAPSYVEPSDVEYSSDEEEGNGEYGAQDQDSTAAQSNDQSNQVDEGAVLEPLKSRGQNRDIRQNGDPSVAQSVRSGATDQGNAPDAARTSDEMFDGDNGTAVTSRKGTVRNTDSFFKDDGVETRKINLTPSLLRDDSNGSVLRSSETKDLKARASLDSLEKDAPPEKGKEDKKRKEKRGMLGGMFKRKDKKSKGDDKELEDSKKARSDLARQTLSPPSRLSPQPKESMESLTQDPQAAKATSPQQRQTGKLQKTPPAKLSPKSSYSQTEATDQKPIITERQNTFVPEQQNSFIPEQQSTFIPEVNWTPPAVSEPNGSMRMVQTEPDLIPEDRGPTLNFDPPVTARDEPIQSGSPRDAKRGMFSPVRDEEPMQSGSLRDASRGIFSPVRHEEPIQSGSPKDTRRGMFSPARDEEHMQSESPKDARRGMFSPIKDVLKSSPAEPKPEKVRKAKHRMHMDDFDSSSEGEDAEHFSERPSYEEQPDSHLSIAQDAQHENHEPQAPTIPDIEPRQDTARERLSESPVEVLPPQEHYRSPQPPPLMVDTSSQEDPSTSPVSPLSSPELIEAPNENTAREETPASTAQSSTPTWSDASLRAYLEDDSDIRDLLVVVHDKSQIRPVGRDHPVVKNLFKEENKKLGEISNRLDGLLGDYLARKQQRTAVR